MRSTGFDARCPLALALLLGAIGLATPSAGVAQEPGGVHEPSIGIELGATPKTVVLEDLEGNPVDLAEFIGDGPVLLQFWALWCENCEALHPRLLAAQRRYGSGVRFLAIAVAVGQSKRAVLRYLETHPVGYPVLWDGEGRAVRAFMAPVTSYIVILDDDGRVAYTGVGAEQDIAAAVDRVLTGGTAISPGDDS